MDKKILSISDAASILGVSDETLRNWEREGKLTPFHTEGGHRRYYRADIEKFMKQADKPKFYLKILNGYSMSFGIRVFLESNREHEIFSQFTQGNYDNRKDLFKKFVLNENLGLLDFTFDIYHEDSYIKMRWAGEKDDDENLGRQDCRNWIWEYNGLRNRVMSKNPEDVFYTGGKIITR